MRKSNFFYLPAETFSDFLPVSWSVACSVDKEAPTLTYTQEKLILYKKILY